ncbi:MAG: tetratricopeptide repeat protein [Pseudomonadota bacterium]
MILPPIRRLCWTLTVVLACLSGCTDAPLPPLPALELAGFDADVVTDLEAAEAAVLAQPQSPDKNARLARLLHSYGQDAWAAACYTRARLLDEDNFELAYLHADVLAKQGDRDGAIDALQRADERRRDYVPATLRQAALLVERGQREQARSLYDRVLNQQPDNPQALLGLAGLTDALPEATALLEKAADPRRPFARAHYALAAAYRKQGRGDDADEQLGHFERFKGREPSLADPILETVSFLNKSKKGQMTRALVLLGRGNSKGAALLLESVLRKDPGHMPAYTYLIVAYGDLGRHELAHQRYETAVELGDVPVQLHGNMGVLKLKNKRYREAEAFFRKALAIDDGYALGHFYLGATLETLGEPAAALAHYSRAVELDPDNRQAGHSLANMKRKLGDYAGAIEQFERIVAFDDELTPVYLRDMATVYERQDEPALALAALSRASQLATDYQLAELATALENERQRLERRVATP